MLIPGCTVTVRSSRSISRILFISFTSTTMPCLSGTAPSVSPVPPARGDDRDAVAVGELHDLGDLLGRAWAARRRRARTPSQRCTGKGAGTRARLKRAERPVKHVLLAADRRRARRRGRRRRLAAAAIPDLGSRPADSATSSIRSTTSTPCFSPCSVSGRSDQTQAETRVSTSSAVALLDATAADLGRHLGPLDAEARAGARAVRPLRHVVDVLEREARDRPQDLARLPVDALALVQPARRRGRSTTRSIGVGQLEPAVADQLGDELDDEHDLEVVVVAEVARVVLGEGDVVVRVEHDDPLRADRAPVGDVVLGEAPRLRRRSPSRRPARRSTTARA